jgi:hypothetical protein
MWVKFTAPFEYKPKSSMTLVYKAGDVANVVKECGEAAIAAKAATEMKKTNKDSEPTAVDGE